MPRGRSIFFGILILLVLFVPGYSKLQELRSRNRGLLDEIEQLKDENLRLSRQIERLEEDPFYIEKKAREKMGLGKKGEIIYKIIDNNQESESK